jgi:hypothetical protein
MALSDEINRMIVDILQASTWTSAGETRVQNFVSEARGLSNPDLEAMIADAMKTSTVGQTSTSKTGSTRNMLASLSKEDAQGILGKAGINPKNIPNLLKMTTSGAGMAGAGLGLASSLGSVFPPIIITMLIAQMIPAIIKELQRPGGIFDKRVKIDARNEAFSVLDRQTRQNTRIGDRQVIIQQFDGFRNFDGYASTSTGELIAKNADRVLDIGLFDRAQGMSSR